MELNSTIPKHRYSRKMISCKEKKKATTILQISHRNNAPSLTKLKKKFLFHEEMKSETFLTLRMSPSTSSRSDD